MEKLPSYLGHTFLLTELFDENWVISPRTLRVAMSSSNGIAFRNLTFPMFLNISSSGTFEGMKWSTLRHSGKDPRMHLRRSSAGFFEPMVVFSPMIRVTKKGLREHRQVMGLIFVFVDHLIVFMVSDSAKYEKNWVLLSMNATHVDMVRAVFPLRVVSCDVNSGVCAKHYHTLRSGAIGPMRGGTSMVEIRPDVFAGWARTHLTGCSCSQVFYRPHLMIICRLEHNYVLTSISAPFDFDVSGLEWPSSPKCQGRDHHLNAIIPSAVADFDETSMMVLFYRHDRDRMLVKICGIIDWIKQLAERPFQVAGENNAGRCAIRAAYDDCRTYPQ
jgi:beta-1,2-mannosyltransferase